MDYFMFSKEKKFAKLYKKMFFIIKIAIRLKENNFTEN